MGVPPNVTRQTTAAPACPGSMAVPQWLLFPQWWLLPACPGSSVVPQWLLFPQWGLFETSCLPLPWLAGRPPGQPQRVKGEGGQSVAQIELRQAGVPVAAAASGKNGAGRRYGRCPPGRVRCLGANGRPSRQLARSARAAAEARPQLRCRSCRRTLLPAASALLQCALLGRTPGSWQTATWPQQLSPQGSSSP